MDGLLRFLGMRLEAWWLLVSAPKTLAVIAFLLLLLVFDLARRGWRLSWSRRAVKGIGATLAIFHLNFLLLPIVWISVMWIEMGYAALGVPSVPAAFWQGTPIWLLVAIGLVTHDFANYWAHRVLHMHWLWPIHAIHHSDHDVNGLTAYRVHALETVVMWASYTLLLTWLGLPADAIGIGAVLITLHVIYVHVDVDWDHGPLRMWLASPRFHRWHHADVKAAYGKNLAGMFPVFDRMFGTYYAAGRCEAPLGAQGVPENDVVRLMLFPFTEWARMAGERLAAARLRIADRLRRPAL